MIPYRNPIDSTLKTVSLSLMTLKMLPGCWPKQHRGDSNKNLPLSKPCWLNKIHILLMCFILIVIDTRVWQEVVSTPQNPRLRVLSIRSSRRSSGENKAFLSFYINFFLE